MSKIVIYDANETDKSQLGQLLPGTYQIEFIEQPLSLANIQPDADLISVFITSRVGREVIERLPQLRCIACRSTGYNNIDLEAAEAKGIVVTNVPTYGEETVAEYVFMLLLAYARKLLPAYQAVKDGVINQPLLTGFDLSGKTIGILGAGHIGQHVAHIAKGFGMQVLAYDPYPQLDKASAIGYEYHNVQEVLACSDIISLHMPGSQANRHFLNRELLGQCKPGALLINTARGELVDNRALIEMLEAKRLGGACLDVLEGEQLLKLEEEELLLRQPRIDQGVLEQSMELKILSQMPNVIITPHNAFNSREAIQRINEATAFSLQHFEDATLPYRVKMIAA